VLGTVVIVQRPKRGWMKAWGLSKWAASASVHDAGLRHVCVQGSGLPRKNLGGGEQV